MAFHGKTAQNQSCSDVGSQESDGVALSGQDQKMTTRYHPWLVKAEHGATRGCVDA